MGWPAPPGPPQASGQALVTLCLALFRETRGSCRWSRNCCHVTLTVPLYVNGAACGWRPERWDVPLVQVLVSPVSHVTESHTGTGCFSLPTSRRIFLSISMKIGWEKWRQVCVAGIRGAWPPLLHPHTKAAPPPGLFVRAGRSLPGGTFMVVLLGRKCG